MSKSFLLLHETFNSDNINELNDLIKKIKPINQNCYLINTNLEQKKFLLLYDFELNEKEEFKNKQLKEYFAVGNYNIYNEIHNNIDVLYILEEKNTENILKNLKNCYFFEKKDFVNYQLITYIVHSSNTNSFNIEYSDIYDEFLHLAKQNKKNIELELEKKGNGEVHITSVVVSKDGQFISSGLNSDFHIENGCVRKQLGYKKGEGYELCKGCQPISHGEQTAIKNAKNNGKEHLLKGSTFYLYGHCRPCADCANKLEEIGIKKMIIGKEFVKDFLKIQ